MDKTKRVYIAALKTEGAVPYTMANGINTHPGTNYTPLAETEADAIKRLLADCMAYKTNPGKTVIIFCLDIPEYKLTRRMTAPENEDLKDTLFYAYKGKVPPEYITDIEEADLSIMDD